MFDWSHADELLLAGTMVALTRPDWPRGLNQLGNTCYLNSLLQYFYTIKDLRDAIAPLAVEVKLMDNDKFKDDDLKNHRVGGRIVSRYEVVRSRKCMVGSFVSLTHTAHRYFSSCFPTRQPFLAYGE